MKKGFLIGLILALLLTVSVACADPLLTDGKTMGWIGENNYLYLKTDSGATRRLSMTVRDLLSFSDTDLYCLMESGGIYAIKRDGSGSSMVARQATDWQIEQLQDQRITLQEGDLKAGEFMISNVAVGAATDGIYVYYVIGRYGVYRLMQTPLFTGLDLVEEISTANLNGIRVIEPSRMTVSRDAIVITSPDHKVMTVSLATGETQTLEAGLNLTQAAAWTDGKLYRYVSVGEDLWALEKIDALADIGQNDETAQLQPLETLEPTAAVTPVPTAVPRVTATPVPTGNNSYAEDGTLRLGDSGDEVRQAQRRLYNLGYPVGRVDGVYGEDTQYAVNLFYDSIGEKEREYMSEKMLKKLYSNSAPEYDPYMPLSKGDSGTLVRRMQQRLGNLGFSAVKLDGIYGKLTVEAVALFQAANGIEPDDTAAPGERASREMLIRLFSNDAVSYATWQAQGSPMGQTTRRGWQKSGTSWLYYDENGVRVTGWKEISGKWYYFDSLGVMQSGWQQIGGNWYYFDKDEGMVTGWFEDLEAEKKAKNGTKLWYWMDENGVMATDWVQIEGVWYYFNNSGVWQPNGEGT